MRGSGGREPGLKAPCLAGQKHNPGEHTGERIRENLRTFTCGLVGGVLGDGVGWEWAAGGGVGGLRTHRDLVGDEVGALLGDGGDVVPQRPDVEGCPRSPTRRGNLPKFGSNLMADAIHWPTQELGENSRVSGLGRGTGPAMPLGWRSKWYEVSSRRRGVWTGGRGPGTTLSLSCSSQAGIQTRQKMAAGGPSGGPDANPDRQIRPPMAGGGITGDGRPGILVEEALGEAELCHNPAPCMTGKPAEGGGGEPRRPPGGAQRPSRSRGLRVPIAKTRATSEIGDG